MGSQQSRKGPDRRLSEDSRARVVNLKAWKARKRIRSMRGRISWTRYVLRQLSYILVILAAGSALLSCVPQKFQAESIIWTWLFAVLGMAVGLVLHVLHDRKWAARLMLVCLGCMTLSLVAGLVTIR
ncbi:hypothetical protein JZ785_08260 [Alicyclobacillus curvatus]|jgi:hypothetical protein|nr:hypothetical protein JZ785_08260 [Alicyclobacillus curvatus]